MPAQLLLLPDGSLPPGTNADALKAAGVLLVRPTKPPIVGPGQEAVDTCDPEQRDGEYWQRWEVRDAPPPDPDMPSWVAASDFLNRFTQDEIFSMMSHPVGMYIYVRGGWYQWFNVNDKADPAGCVASIHNLAALGLLAPERLPEILAPGISQYTVPTS